MGAARLGFVATFMSDPMISGFTTGSAVLVVISQMNHILGLKVPQFSRPVAAPKVIILTEYSFFLWKGHRCKSPTFIGYCIKIFFCRQIFQGHQLFWKPLLHFFKLLLPNFSLCGVLVQVRNVLFGLSNLGTRKRLFWANTRLANYCDYKAEFNHPPD